MVMIIMKKLMISVLTTAVNSSTDGYFSTMHIKSFVQSCCYDSFPHSYSKSSIFLK